MKILTEPRKYSGKWFTPDDIAQINLLITEHSKAHRAALSRLVCQTFNWKKINGELKEMSCRVAMLAMHRENIIGLPEPLRKKYPSQVNKKRTPQGEPGLPIHCAVTELDELQFQIVEKANSALWNELIDRYHYLGYTPMSGAQLRYFIYSNNQTVALLSFGASAWTTAPRDKFIGWTHSQRKEQLHHVINNARFLILPWVRVPNLASKLLSMAARRVQVDWLERYHYQPVLLETFVAVEQFKGTCYKAANWQCLGTTTGRGKKGDQNANIGIKSVWVYPLTRNFTKVLCA